MQETSAQEADLEVTHPLPDSERGFAVDADLLKRGAQQRPADVHEMAEA